VAQCDLIVPEKNSVRSQAAYFLYRQLQTWKRVSPFSFQLPMCKCEFVQFVAVVEASRLWRSSHGCSSYPAIL